MELFLQIFTLTIVSFASLILTISVAIYNRKCPLALSGLLSYIPTLIEKISLHQRHYCGPQYNIPEGCMDTLIERSCYRSDTTTLGSVH